MVVVVVKKSVKPTWIVAGVSISQSHAKHCTKHNNVLHTESNTKLNKLRRWKRSAMPSLVSKQDLLNVIKGTFDSYVIPLSEEQRLIIYEVEHSLPMDYDVICKLMTAINNQSSKFVRCDSLIMHNVEIIILDDCIGMCVLIYLTNKYIYEHPVIIDVSCISREKLHDLDNAIVEKYDPCVVSELKQKVTNFANSLE